MSEIASSSLSARSRHRPRQRRAPATSRRVLAECRSWRPAAIRSSPASANDVPLADFGRLFGYERRVRRCSSRPSSKRSSTRPRRRGLGGPMRPGRRSAARRAAGAVRAGAADPRDVLPAGVAEPEAGFTVTADRTRRGSHALHARDRWPVARTTGTTLACGADDVAGPEARASRRRRSRSRGGGPNVAFEGAWALFRLLDAAQLEREIATALRPDVQARRARGAACASKPTSVRNPFGKT